MVENSSKDQKKAGGASAQTGFTSPNLNPTMASDSAQKLAFYANMNYDRRTKAAKSAAFEPKIDLGQKSINHHVETARIRFQ